MKNKADKEKEGIMNKKKYIDKRIKTNVSQECIEEYL